MSTPQEQLKESLRLALSPKNGVNRVHYVLSNIGPFFLLRVYNDPSTSVEWKDVVLVWLCSLALDSNKEVKMAARNALIYDCGHHIDADTDTNITLLMNSICDRIMTPDTKVFLTMLNHLGNVVFCMNNPREFEESVFQLKGYFMLYDLTERFTANKSVRFLVTYALSLLGMIVKSNEFVPHIAYMLDVLCNKKVMVERKLQTGLLLEIHEHYCELTGVSQPYPTIAMIEWCIDHVVACLKRRGPVQNFL